MKINPIALWFHALSTSLTSEMFIKLQSLCTTLLVDFGDTADALSNFNINCLLIKHPLCIYLLI